MIHLVENAKIRQIHEPKAGPNDTTDIGNYVNLAEAHMCYIVVNVDEGAANDYKLRLWQTDGTTPKALAKTVPVWINDDADDMAEDFERQTNAVLADIDAGTNEVLVVFQVNPAKLDIENDYHSISVQIDSDTDNTDASGYTFAATAYVLPARYQHATD